MPQVSMKFFDNHLEIHGGKEGEASAPIDFSDLLQSIRESSEAHGPWNTIRIVDVAFATNVHLRRLPDIGHLQLENCSFSLLEYSFTGIQNLEVIACSMAKFRCHAIVNAGHILMEGCRLGRNGEIDVRHPKMTGNFMIRNLACSDSNGRVYFSGGQIEGELSLSELRHMNYVEIKNLKANLIKISELSARSKNGDVLWIGDTITSGVIEVVKSQISGVVKIVRCKVGGELGIQDVSITRNEGARLVFWICSCRVDQNIKLEKVHVSSLSRITETKVDGQIVVKNCKLRCGQDNLKLTVDNYNAFSVLNCDAGQDILVKDSEFFGGFTAHDANCSKLGLIDCVFSNGIFDTRKVSRLGKVITRFFEATLGIERTRKLGLRPERSSHYQISLSKMSISKELSLRGLAVTDESCPFIRVIGTDVRLADDRNFLFPSMKKFNLELEGYNYELIRNSGDYSDLRQRIKLMRQNLVRGDYHPPSPQPFFHLSSVLLKAGDTELADLAQLAGHRAITHNTRNPISKASRWVLDLCFGYGLSRLRAAITVASWVTIGAIGTSIALERDVFVIDTLRVAASSIEESPGNIVPATTVVDQDSGRMDVFDCNDQINPLFYTIESMIPIIEFGQVKQCIPRLAEGASGPTQAELNKWWAAKVGFVVIGWVIISIAVITFSGLIRRRD